MTCSNRLLHLIKALPSYPLGRHVQISCENIYSLSLTILSLASTFLLMLPVAKKTESEIYFEYPKGDNQLVCQQCAALLGMCMAAKCVRLSRVSISVTWDVFLLSESGPYGLARLIRLMFVKRWHVFNISTYVISCTVFLIFEYAHMLHFVVRHLINACYIQYIWSYTECTLDTDTLYIFYFIFLKNFIPFFERCVKLINPDSKDIYLF